MFLSSTSFEDGGDIPVMHANKGVPDGENISFSLAWSGAPPETKSFAVSVVDPHPVANNWVHWLAVDIPANTDHLEEGASLRAMPPGTVELLNSFGKTGYGGPQPPPGTGAHPYVAIVYALNVDTLEISADGGLQGLQAALEGHVLGRAEITGYYER